MILRNELFALTCYRIAASAFLFLQAVSFLHDFQFLSMSGISYTRICIHCTSCLFFGEGTSLWRASTARQ